MNATIAKMIIGVLLGIAWVVLAILGKTDVSPLVAFIQTSLAGLAAHALTMVNPAGRDVPPPTSSAGSERSSTQGGFAMPSMLIVLALGVLLLMGGCASIIGPAATPQSAQIAYTQACAAYGAAFEGALQMRIAGKLNQAQIDQVTTVDAQITPICTGALPVDPASATQQITAAVTTLAIFEAIKQVGK